MKTENVIMNESLNGVKLKKVCLISSLLLCFYICPDKSLTINVTVYSVNQYIVTVYNTKRARDHEKQNSMIIPRPSHLTIKKTLPGQRKKENKKIVLVNCNT